MGEEQQRVDYMAHCWGFLAGLAEGVVVEAVRLRERATVRSQRLASVLTLTAIAAAWWLTT